MLVARHVTDRNELVGEASRLVGGGPAALRLERERVLILARHAPPLGDVLARLAHRLRREQLGELRIREAPAERRVVQRPLGAIPRLRRLRRDERGARHRLLAARDEQIAVARDHRVTRADDRSEAGRAQPVDGDAADRVGKPREQRRHARDVAVVLAGLVRGAEPDVLDLIRRDARTRDGFADDDRREIVGAHVGERAAVAADRRADRGEDDGAAHYPLRRRAGRRLRSCRAPSSLRSCAEV